MSRRVAHTQMLTAAIPCLEAGRYHVTGGPLDIEKDELIRGIDEVIEVDGHSTYERVMPPSPAR